MNKYYFVLYSGQHGDFIERLQDLGLVDVTVSGWEPGDEDRALLQTIEQQTKALQRVEELASDRHYAGGQPFADGAEAFAGYSEAAAGIDGVETRLAQARGELAEIEIWGDVSPERMAALADAGVELRFYATYAKEYRERAAAWESEYNMKLIRQTPDGMAYFVVVASPGQELDIDAQQMKAPASTADGKRGEIALLEEEKRRWESVMARVVASADLLRSHAAHTREELRRRQTIGTARREAEGTLTVLEGWATQESSEKVDAMLEGYPNLVYLKSTPTPEDETPVALKNNRFASAFEFISNFYNPPRYGTMDLTPLFAPFYMIFFGFCLADAGYGLLVLFGGLFMLMKGGRSMRLVSQLSVWCGAATVVFGLLQGSFFGIELGRIEWFSSLRGLIVLNRDNLFTLALVFGVIQLLFAMGVKAYAKARAFGLRYAFSTIGWMLVLLALVAGVGLPMMDVPVAGFAMGSPAFLAVVGIGLFMMLFMNSPGKNPLVNFGNGLWNTYNDVTGTLGDFLSYIRLFAIGLSGGILAQVFNDLAIGMSPDIPVAKQLVALIILLIGHGLNLFMSVLSSFVHPMRLTFVEFYKNAGFEAGQRRFSPLKREE